MQITLGHEDVQEALETYIGNQGIKIQGKKVDFNVISGRKGNGIRIEVLISNASTDSFIDASTPPTAEEVKAEEVVTEPKEVQEEEVKEEEVKESVSLWGTA